MLDLFDKACAILKLRNFTEREGDFLRVFEISTKSFSDIETFLVSSLIACINHFIIR
jgi:hypothetical protein